MYPEAKRTCPPSKHCIRYVLHDDATPRRKSHRTSPITPRKNTPQVFPYSPVSDASPHAPFSITSDSLVTSSPFTSSPFTQSPLQHTLPITSHASPFDLPEIVAKIVGYADHIPGSLYSCLQVNRLWYRAARECLDTRILFRNDAKFVQYVRTAKPVARPSHLALSQLTRATAAAVHAMAANVDASQLRHLEMFMCPKFTLPATLLSTALQSLVLSGCSLVDDTALHNIGARCRDLRKLDLRACHLVSDAGIISIAQNCRDLQFINLGRHRDGHLVTDASVRHLGRSGRLHTLGLAGCDVSDEGLWEVTTRSGATLERIAVSNCHNVTDRSVGRLLQMDSAPRLSVLEIKHCRMASLRCVVEFKRRQFARGVCVQLTLDDAQAARMAHAEVAMDVEISKAIFRDLLEWANDENDGDAKWQAMR